MHGSFDFFLFYEECLSSNNNFVSYIVIIFWPTVYYICQHSTGVNCKTHNFYFFFKKKPHYYPTKPINQIFLLIQVGSISSFSLHCKYEYRILPGLREKTPFNQSSSGRHIPKCIFCFLISYPVPHVWHSRRQIFFRASKTPQAVPTATDMQLYGSLIT